MSKLFYGPHEILIKDDEELVAVANRIEDAANSGKAQWVEARSETRVHRLFIQPGIPVYIREASEPTIPRRIR